jgi:DNA repair protein RadD
VTRQLRPYQTAAIDAARGYFRAGHRRILLVSPTGSGKSTIGAAFVVSFFRKSPGLRVAWFAHRRELVYQARDTLAAFEIAAGAFGEGASFPMQLVSTQGALTRDEVPEADLVIIDEAHHYAAAEWKLVLDSYGPKTIIVGLTATPERADGAALDFFTALHEVTTTREMVDLWLETDGKEGLVPVETYRPDAPEKAGTLAQTPCVAYLEHNLRGRKAVVFAASVADAERFAAEFREAKIAVEVIHGKLPKEERDRRLASPWTVLCNVMVLTEGWDRPEVSAVILASRCGSFSGLIQRVGRGRRPFPGKTICTILDLPGVTHLLGDVDEERIFSLEGQGVSRKVAAGYSFCKTCGNLMPDEGACTVCGRPRDERTLDISGNKLDKFARFQADSEEMKSYRLAKWIARAKASGVNWKREIYRYESVYKEKPPNRIMSRAHAMVRGSEWCGACGHSRDGKRCKCRTNQPSAPVT